ncbi:hypothetical protein ECANGB1_1869 [Enterospora canceri]|uniref:Uncharacterized protein n=1 Tax=Enterospora canceri TaxID=1081671 RepID=A0A1Y1S5D5_9MICR|nr:hypothetical protein ECANGB1_1869 [Enterospora canceri]
MAFLSRSFLIDWLKENRVVISRIEEVGTGLPLINLINSKETEKITNYKQNPKTEQDFVYNLTRVKTYYEGIGMKICMPVERMAKRRLQDNLEVLQLVYNLYEKREVKRNGSVTTVMNEKKSRPINRVELKDPHKDVSELHKQNEELNKQNEELLMQNEKSLSELNRLRYQLAQGKSSTDEIDLYRTMLEETKKKCGAKVEKYAASFIKFENEIHFYYNKLVEVEKLIKVEMDDGDLKRRLLELLYTDK